MKERRLAALVDRPGSRSQGMLALILVEGGVRYISGTKGGVRKMIPDDGDFDLLVRNSDILKVEEMVIPRVLMNPVAHWIGNEFARRCRELQAPEFPDMEKWRKAGRGRFILGEPGEVFPFLESWIKSVALAALKEPKKGSDYASLMAQTLPAHPLTCAVTWHFEDGGENGIWLNFYSQQQRKSKKKLCAEFGKTIETLLKEIKR